MIANPEHYGFKANHSSDETVYTRPLGGGTLIVEVFPHFWIEYYSPNGRMQTFTEKDCKPLSTLRPFLEQCHQVL